MRAVVLGNAVWDETLHLAALPRPGASIHARRGAAGPGGKGLNQAVLLARAGVPTTLVARVGRDAWGEALAAALAAEGLAAGLLLADAAVASDWSGVLVAEDGENAILTTREAALSLGPEEVEAVLSKAAPGDLCLLQGNLSLAATAAAIAAARGRGMRVALNPSPVDPGLAPLFAGVDALFVNRDEARAFTGRDGAEAALALRAAGAGAAVLTLGPEGALLAHGAGVERVAASPVRAVDPTGAGDVFLAASLAHAAPRGWRLDASALAAGARAAALSVSRAGAFAALPTREEIAAIMASR